MVFIPVTVLGRLLLGAIVFLYICLLVLNLVSYGGLAWITSDDSNTQFGLWRVCVVPMSAARTCFQWSDVRDAIATATNNLIDFGKPGFIRAAEGLETVSLIFYVFAGLLIIIGIIDLDRAPLEYMFGAAALLLFLCIVFLSASLGVMSVQGRDNVAPAHRDWAWWVGLAGLIVTIVCVISILGFIFYTIRTTPREPNQDNNFGQMPHFRNLAQGQLAWNSFPPMIMANDVPSSFLYPSYGQWPQGYQTGQFNPNINLQNPFFAYTDINQPQLSPALAALVQQRLSGYY